MCIRDNKMYFYTENGILVDRILFRDLAEKCGKPDTINVRGYKKLFFRKSFHSIESFLVQINIDRLKEFDKFLYQRPNY